MANMFVFSNLLRSNEGFFLPRNPNLKFQSHERLYELSPNEHNADGYQGFYGDGFTGHGHPSHLNNNPSSKQPANIPDYDYFVNQSNPEVLFFIHGIHPSYNSAVQSDTIIW